MQDIRLLFAAAFLLLNAAMGTQSSYGLSDAQSDQRISKIDVFMHTLYTRGQFNGAILVGGPAGILYQAAFGLADRSNSTLFTVDTESCLASVSKPFTAMAVMMLVQQGSIHLDDPISGYVDGLKSPVGAVTIRQLLTHTSGVPDYSDLNIEHPGITSTQIIAALRAVDHLEFSPGEKYGYSNSGYVLLAAAVQKVTGVPFPQFLQKRILGPIGMKRTFVLTDQKQKTSAVARGYDGFGTAVAA
jgi:CubicO group peptidase (beta-lactamase class C family)